MNIQIHELSCVFLCFPALVLVYYGSFFRLPTSAAMLRFYMSSFLSHIYYLPLIQHARNMPTLKENTRSPLLPAVQL